MQTLSPSVDRLGAALRALRQAYAGGSDAGDRTALGAKCLHVLIAQLAQEGVPQEDLQPLVDLEAGIEALKSQTQGQGSANRRRRKPPSDILLARLAVLIDLLGVPPPQQGGDARGWKRLLAWRENLSHGIGSADAKDEYRDFTRDIEAIPTNERLSRVLDEQLWDRRRKPR